MRIANLNAKFNDLKIIIGIHEFHVAGGPGQDLELFLKKNKIYRLLYIIHPLLYAKIVFINSSRYRYYEQGKLIRQHNAYQYKLLEPLLYVKDLFYTLFWSFAIIRKCNLFIGFDPLNALAGIILQKLGLAKKVVYYSIDYFPTRFENRIMNKIYHIVDKLCVRYATETWNVGQMMSQAREKSNGMKGRDYERQYVVPIGVWYDRVQRKPFEKINKKKIIYAGHLISYMGVDLAIRAMPAILNVIPDASLEIIGMGEDEMRLRKMVKDLHLTKHIYFKEYIADRKKFEARLSDGAIGLAPFNTDILDDKIKNADPGKIKDYMLCGMPVVTTRALANYSDIEKGECGIVINYSIEELANAVISLLKNETLLKKYRKNASIYVKQFDWETIFANNFKRILN